EIHPLPLIRRAAVPCSPNKWSSSSSATVSPWAAIGMDPSQDLQQCAGPESKPCRLVDKRRRTRSRLTPDRISSRNARHPSKLEAGLSPEEGNSPSAPL